MLCSVVLVGPETLPSACPTVFASAVDDSRVPITLWHVLPTPRVGASTKPHLSKEAITTRGTVPLPIDEMPSGLFEEEGLGLFGHGGVKSHGHLLAGGTQAGRRGQFLADGPLGHHH